MPSPRGFSKLLGRSQPQQGVMVETLRRVPELARRFGVWSCSQRGVQDLILHAPLALDPDRKGLPGSSSWKDVGRSFMNSPA